MAAVLTHMVVLVCLLGLPGMPTQVMREVPLDASVKTHMVSVQGFPGMITTIQLPDAFEAVNVLCGECIDMDTQPVDVPSAPGMQNAPHPNEAVERVGGHDARNWLIEKHPRERSIHVRPAQLPSKTNPVSAFSTNVFVTLDGGHAINISLSLYSPQAAASSRHAHEGPDAVVTLSLPGPEKLTGKLAEAQAQLQAKHDKDTQDTAHRWLLERLSGEVQCHRSAWRRPYRTDRTVVRIEQSCVSKSPSPTFWAVFVVENRGDTLLHLAHASLEPDTGMQMAHGAFEDPSSMALGHLFDRNDLALGQVARGVVSATLKPGALWPERWRLQVVPASDDRQAISIAPVTF